MLLIGLGSRFCGYDKINIKKVWTINENANRRRKKKKQEKRNMLVLQDNYPSEKKEMNKAFNNCAFGFCVEEFKFIH